LRSACYFVVAPLGPPGWYDNISQSSGCAAHVFLLWPPWGPRLVQLVFSGFMLRSACFFVLAPLGPPGWHDKFPKGFRLRSPSFLFVVASLGPPGMTHFSGFRMRSACFVCRGLLRAPRLVRLILSGFSAAHVFLSWPPWGPQAGTINCLRLQVTRCGPLGASRLVRNIF
jgi:hypothetical protein